jgi:hypothetical protein
MPEAPRRRDIAEDFPGMPQAGHAVPGALETPEDRRSRQACAARRGARVACRGNGTTGTLTPGGATVPLARVSIEEPPGRERRCRLLA